MLGRISISVMLAAALLLGVVRVPAAPCILSNAPAEKACPMGCCEYKSCCETSQKRTGSPVQPLAQSVSDQQNIATLASTVPVTVFDQAATELFVFSRAEGSAHSPSPLALSCIRLI
jgi:hypothetical protein